MNDNEHIPAFSVIGGPLNKLGLRLGLVRKGADSTRFGIVLGLFVWLMLFILSIAEGKVSNFFSSGVIGGHVRFLAAVPLFFICETFVLPQMQAFVNYLVQSGLVVEEEQSKLSAIIHRINRVKNSWIVEGVLFLLMFVLANTSIFPNNSTSAAYIIKKAGGHVTITNAFYLWFCLPLFRFLLLRWVWHLTIWWYFLYRIQQLNLRLIPTHSDGAAGLGYLGVVQEYFTPLAAAFSAIIAASSVEEIITGALPFESLYYVIPLALVLNLFFFAGPLFIFFSKLKHCRVEGLKNYMIMATRYVDAFDKRWIRDKNATGESQLGSGDIQSLADLTNSLKTINEMRSLPVSNKLFLSIAISAILPFLPLFFIKFNLNELIALLFKLLTG